MIKKIKSYLIDISKKNSFFRKLFRGLRFLFQRINYLKYSFRRVNDFNIIFESFIGKKYCDSPKAMYLKMINDKRYDKYTFIWAFDNPEKYKFLEKNKNTIVIKHGSKQYYKYYASSKYWITNSRISDAILKKKNQIYVQCWHGTPLKRLGYDIEVKSGNAMNSLEDIRYKYRVDSKKYTYMISPSKFCTDKLISAFNLKAVNKEDIIIEKGYPRNDFLINYDEKDVKNIKKALNIPLNKKIILYAPTWRDNQHTSGLGYTYKTEVDFNYLKKELSKDYIILFRAHYLVANCFDFNKYSDFIYDVSGYDDINDLYIISDILITDYSSVFFDYANLKRSIIFYMYDLDEYKNNLRDFYIKLDELPGNIVLKEKELVKEIKKEFKFDKRYEKFNAKYNYLDDGKASDRVIEEVMKEGWKK